MRADELAERYAMGPHVENGRFCLCHESAGCGQRPASGSIYYYVSPGERTEFHKIDCDEYWIFNAGCALEIWVIETDGALRIRHCGTAAGAEPKVFFRAGEIFASRLSENADDGAFVTCITIPRFSEEGFTLFRRDEMVRRYPETAAFWA